ncbi:MAG: hypothetical protein N3A68_06925 [Bacteroidia bacterium]|nr:hypothetical protein [Bacteroidia bacterium]GIV23375.1 MAG: hypothetical protein KatS3mg025_1034 [Bacteroidia bacterium]
MRYLLVWGLGVSLWGCTLLERRAEPIEFAGTWEGEVEVTTQKPDGTKETAKKQIKLSIMPNPLDEEKEKGKEERPLLVFYNDLPMPANIRGRRFHVEEETKERFAMIIGFLGLLAKGDVELTDFKMEGKLRSAGEMKYELLMKFRVGEKKGSIEQEGVLRRTSERFSIPLQ